MLGRWLMMQFEYHNPVNIIFGRGKLARVGEISRKHGGKALIVTSGSSFRTGVLTKVIDNIIQAGLNYVVYDKVKANPLTTMAQDGAIIARRERCDIVIGVGGGSAMDAAKAIAFMAVNEGDVSDYIYGKSGKGALPLILITTTAGTGSEGNCFAVLTNPETKDKKALRSRHIYAKASIIDPELLTTVPQRSIVATGLDALFHAIEAYIARRSTPVTDIFALQAISLLAKNLPEVYSDRTNIDAWEKVALANTLAGMAIDGPGTTLAHGMEHPVSGLFDVPHGEGLAALFIPIMEFSQSETQEKLAIIAKTMGANVDGITRQQAAQESMSCVRKMLEKLNMTPRLRDFGIAEEHIRWLAVNALKTMKATIDNNPVVPSQEEIEEIYRKCL